jgi:ubiquinone/menaquinone biosynthesis C-methylase UbiE
MTRLNVVADVSSGVSSEPDERSERELVRVAVGIWKARALYAAAQLGLPDQIAAGHDTVEKLARATGTHARSLHRLLRALAGLGALTESTPGRFALRPLGAALKTGAPGRAIMLTLAGDWQWKAWDGLLFSLRTGAPALHKVFGKSLFDYLDANPEDGALFNQAMVGIHGPDGDAMTAAFDFSSIKSVVDVGGGTGKLLATLLNANAHLRGVLFDLPDTVAQAKRHIASLGLSQRCDLIAGDFFEQVPKGHDAYVLAHVLHDWTDGQAIEILRNCRKAIAPGGRVLILEAVLPEGDTPHEGKLMDLLMLTITGGVERTADQYAALLAAANFRLTRTVSVSTHQSVVEGAPI